MFGFLKRSKQPLPALYYLSRCADYYERGYGRAACPQWLIQHYRGHGATFHLWDVPEVELEDGAYADLLANDLHHPLVSERLRDVLESQRHLTDIISWLEVEVKSIEHGPRTYYLLHLPYRKRILAWRSGHYGPNGGIIETPPVSTPLIGEHRIFTYLHPERWHEVILRQDVVDALRDNSITGHAFMPVSVTDAVVPR